MDRWQNIFLDADDPVFILNRHKRIEFLNPACEKLLGIPLADVRGLVCKRRTRQAANTLPEELQVILAPPAEVLHGKAIEVRRLAPLQLANNETSRWWDVAFLPLRSESGLAGIAGRITPVPGRAFLSEQPLPESIIAIRQRFVERFALERLDCHEPAMQRVREQVRLAAQTRVAVTLSGESGSGKHWLARAIHRLSERREQPFAGIDCSRLPQTVLAEAVFGERGLLRRPHLGTVYLREPAALPRELQAVLADMINAGQSSDEPAHWPRFLAGFCSDVKDELNRGRLLPQLLAVLAPIVIELPPLRQRASEIPSFAAQFAQSLAGAEAMVAISPEALQVLSTHDWPGNLYELRRVIAGAHKHVGSNAIDIGDLPFYLRASAVTSERTLPLDVLLEQVEKRLIAVALQAAQNNKSKAAALLAIWRPRLIRRMQALGFAGAADEDTTPGQETQPTEE